MAKIAGAQTCPVAGTWLPLPLMSDVGISNAANLSNSNGTQSGCKPGGTGWHATKHINGVATDVVVSCYHVLGSSGIAGEPDIGARGCQLFKTISLPCDKCPLGVACVVQCSGVSATNFWSQLGTIKGGVKPQPSPAVNLDDVSYAVSNNSGKMLPTISNITGPIGAPWSGGSTLSLPVQFNGETSCYQQGNMKLVGVGGCFKNGTCFTNIDEASITAAPGDSGSLITTQNGNQPFGMLIGGDAKTGLVSMIPIAQVIKDIGLDVVAGSSPGVAEPETAGEGAVKATIARNQWIKKMPHVMAIGYGMIGGEITIVVTVDKPENVSGVGRKLPARLDGFPVDVQEALMFDPL